jgi:hypothetical protein
VYGPTLAGGVRTRRRIVPQCAVLLWYRRAGAAVAGQSPIIDIWLAPGLGRRTPPVSRPLRPDLPVKLHPPAVSEELA